MRITETWRLRFILITAGVALGFIAKWLAGHYQEPAGNGNPPAEQAVRRVIDVTPPRLRQNPAFPLANSLLRHPTVPSWNVGEY